MSDEYAPLTVSAGRRFTAFLALYVATVGPFLAAVLA